MFTIIDRYILKKYIVTFFFVMAILLLVICVIDYTEKNEDFITKNAPIKAILIDYYLNFIPYIVNLISPIIIFIATIIVTARLAARTEIIAILASGVSFQRFLVPFIIGSTLIGICIFYLYGWVIPRASKIRHSFENVYVRGRYFFDKRNFHIKIGPTTYAYIESYNNMINTGYLVTLENIENNKLTSKISSNRMIWLPDAQKWRFEFYTLHTFDNMKETITKGEFLDTSLVLQPKDFETQHMLYEQLTIDELNQHIALLRERGSEGTEPYLVEKYGRMAYPFAIVILTLMGVIVSAQKSRGGVGLKIAFGFLLAFIYIIFVWIGRSIANVGNMPAEYSAWIPNALFSIIGFIMYLRLPK